MLTVRDQVALQNSKPPFLPVGGVYRLTPPTYTDGQAAVMHFDASGQLKVAGSFVVDSEFPAAGALADATANPTTTVVGAFSEVFNGTTWERQRSAQVSNSTTVTGFTNQLPMARYNASPTARTEGQFGNLQASANGGLNVNLESLIAGEDQSNSVMQVAQKPLAVSTYTPDLDTSAAAEKSSVTKASAGNLYGFSATNSNAVVRYLQFFNSTTVPADATVPVLEFVVPALGGVFFQWPFGRQFTTGIAWCFSTTSQAKTIITVANDALVDVNYK